MAAKTMASSEEEGWDRMMDKRESRQACGTPQSIAPGLIRSVDDLLI